MSKDPCHELEMARAGLAGVRQRLALAPESDATRVTLETAAAGLEAEISWWQPRCERELQKEKR